jgi:hypothetical protein
MGNDREPRSLDILLDLGIDGFPTRRHLRHRIIPLFVSSYNCFCDVIKSFLLGHALSAEDVDNIVVMFELENMVNRYKSLLVVRGKTDS